MMKVLVTGAGALLGQGIIRSILHSSLEATIIAADPRPESAGLYWSDQQYLVPMAADPGYMVEIKEILGKEGPDIVLLGTDPELVVFSRHRRALEEEFQTHILVSSPEVVAIAEDKYRTYEFLRDRGFDVPRSCLPGASVEELIAQVGFPLIVKPRIGARSVGTKKVHDHGELGMALEAQDNLIIQECVGGDEDEYTAGVLAFDGEIQTSIVMRRDLRDGNTYRAYVEEFSELNRAVRRIAQELDIFGPCNLQFRLDEEGRVKVFEINARFSGTTPFRALAGLNEVELCLRKLVNGEEIHQPRIDQMTILRHWTETVVRPADSFDGSESEDGDSRQQFLSAGF